MPVQEVMGWNKNQKRWFKRYRGRLYFVSPKQLGCEPTKEASRQRSNDWWEAKQAEIDEALGQAKKHPVEVVKAYQDAMEKHRLYAKWLRRYGQDEEGWEQNAQSAETALEWLQEALQSDRPPFPLSPEQSNPLIWIANLEHHEYIRWLERFNQVRREEREEQGVPKENTIRAHLDDYLALRGAQATAIKRLGSHDTFKGRLLSFRKWVDPFLPVEALNEALWERFCVHLSQEVSAGKIAPATQAGILGATRAFIRSRWERRLIDLPRNLNSRVLSACVRPKKITIFSVDEIRQLLGAASDRKKLYLMLMLNTGCYPVDIGQLRQDEVDWKHGRIRRKRSKTRDRSENVPEVDYPLWAETFALLKQFRNTTNNYPDLALLNVNGTPIWAEVQHGDKFFRNSNIRSAYFQLQQKIGLKKEQCKPLKSIRKTSASLLETHPDYGRYAEYFLGEAPATIATKHYIQPSGEQFDKAVMWLRKAYKIGQKVEEVVEAVEEKPEKAKPEKAKTEKKKTTV